MKIALCLSGHLRTFEQTQNSLSQFILKKYNPDIFIHTWDKLGFACNYKSDRFLHDTSNKLSQIERLYRPKKIIVESSKFIEQLKLEADEYAPHLKHAPKHVGHMASMFYKIYACNELRKIFELETGNFYDYIIRCRADLLFENILSLPEPIEKNIVLIPGFISGAGWYTDQFAFGDSDSMDIYSSLYFDIPDYFLAGKEFYPEKFVVWALDKKNLPVKFIDTKFRILR